MAYTWDYMNDQARAEADGLPIDGVVALLELMAAMELDPWGVSGADPGGPNMPDVAFGAAGMVSLLILDESREVLVTKVQWAG